MERSCGVRAGAGGTLADPRDDIALNTCRSGRAGAGQVESAKHVSRTADRSGPGAVGGAEADGVSGDGVVAPGGGHGDSGIAQGRAGEGARRGLVQAVVGDSPGVTAGKDGDAGGRPSRVKEIKDIIVTDNDAGVIVRGD